MEGYLRLQPGLGDVEGITKYGPDDSCRCTGHQANHKVSFFQP
jgi:hypothetical protein